MDTRPFEALCSQITVEIGPWCSPTPEGRRKDLEREATAREAPFTLQGVEVAQPLNVAKVALGLRCVFWKKDGTQVEKKGAREALLQALNGADLTLGHQVKGIEQGS